MASTNCATWDSQHAWPIPPAQLHGYSSWPSLLPSHDGSAEADIAWDARAQKKITQTPQKTYRTTMGDWYREEPGFLSEVTFGESIELGDITPDALALQPPIPNLTTKQDRGSYVSSSLHRQLLSNTQDVDSAASSVSYTLPNHDDTHTTWMANTSTLGLLATHNCIHTDQALPEKAHSTNVVAQGETRSSSPSNTHSHENGSGYRRARIQKHPASFRCELCPSSFTRSTTLREHVRAHFGDRRFRCTICHKTFVHMKSWNRHEAAHSQEKRFICNGTMSEDSPWGCGHRFSREDGLVAHLRSQIGRNCLQPLVESGEIYQPLQDVSTAEFTCRGFLSNGQQWGCGQKFLNQDDVNTHFDSENSQACLRHFVARYALGLQKSQQDSRKEREDNGHATSPNIPPQESTGFVEKDDHTNTNSGAGGSVASEREPESVVGEAAVSSEPRLWTRVQDGNASNALVAETHAGHFRRYAGLTLITEPAMQKGKRAQPLKSKKRVGENTSRHTIPQGPLRLTLQSHRRVLQENEIFCLNLRSSSRLESLTSIFISLGRWECQVEWSLYFSEKGHGYSDAQFEYRIKAKAPHFAATRCRFRNQVPVVLYFHDSTLKGIGLRRSFDLGVFALN